MVAKKDLLILTDFIRKVDDHFFEYVTAIMSDQWKHIKENDLEEAMVLRWFYTAINSALLDVLEEK